MTRPVSARAIHNLVLSGEQFHGNDVAEVTRALVERMLDDYSRCDTIEEHLLKLMGNHTLIISDGMLVEPTVEQLMELTRRRHLGRSQNRPGNQPGPKRPRGHGGLKGWRNNRSYHGRPQRDRKRLRALRRAHTSISAAPR